DSEGQMGGESGEYRLAALEVPKHRVAEHHVAVSRLAARLRTGLGAGRCEVDEPGRIWHWERAQQDLVEQREHSGVGADPERERNDRDAGDERRLEEGAEGQRDVSHPGSEPEGVTVRKAIAVPVMIPTLKAWARQRTVLKHTT